MRKSLYALIAAGMLAGSSMLVARTGVLVHEKDGTTTFFPSEDVESVEFVNDYNDETDPSDTQQPGGEGSGDIETPGSGDGQGNSDSSQGGDKEESDTNGGNGAGQPGNGGETGEDNPQDPSTPPSSSDKDPGSGKPEDKPGDAGESGENNGGNQTDKPNQGGQNGDSNSGDQNGEDNQGSQIPPAQEDPDGSQDNQEGNKNEEQGDTGNGNTETKPDDESQKEADAFYHFTDNSIKLDRTYLLVANGLCAAPVDVANSYGYLPSASVKISNQKIEGNTGNGLTFVSGFNSNGQTYTLSGDKFLIKDTNGRYLYLKGTYNSFNLATEPEIKADGDVADEFVFTASKLADGTWKISNIHDGETKSIAFSSKYNTFAAYTSFSNTDYYPSLYIWGTEDEAGETAGGSGGSSGGESSGGSPDNTVAPDNYKYPLTYVKLPEGTPQQVKDYTSFTVNYNKSNHTANYVAWELLDSETSGSANRNSYKYWVDNDIEGCLSTDFGYSSYNYERGHMCPAADNKWSGAAMKDCMVMTNMCPQLRELNSGLWGTLEEKERSWANRDGAIWIIAGPIYAVSDNLYVGDAQARVASSYFKAFLYTGSKPRAIAFIFQNGSNPGNLSNYAVSIDELERQTGYDFFPALDDSIEEAIESVCDFSAWN
ncbi:MAG: DNA/RNA non-specific endonuclease [Muribaculaceae bacterium]|nr:DNA/RNA non-specific endonuclease [Muribaculaceae bacterium]